MDRVRPAGDTRPNVPDYTTVDLTLRSNSGLGKWNFSTSVHNLFNTTVLEPSLAPGTTFPYDLPLPGRSVYLQAEYKF